MPPPQNQRSFPETITGSGSISITGNPREQRGEGQRILDQVPLGFWAVITARVAATGANAYAFTAVDDGTPASFPQLTDQSQKGDGISRVAWEVNQRADVPVDGTAKVRLEPNRLGPGFTFSWEKSTSSGGVTADQLTPLVNYLISASDTWESNAANSIVLPGAGTYMLFAVIGAQARVSAGAPGLVWARLHDGTGGILGTEVVVLAVQQNSALVQVTGFTSVRVKYVATGSVTITIQGYRSSAGNPPTWAFASVPYGTPNANVGVLGYEKIG